MNGKVIVGFLVVFSLGFGAALIYFQNYAFYTPVDPSRMETAEIRLMPVDADAPEVVVTRNFQGIDATTSPLKFRGCFEVDMSLGMLTETYRVMDAPTPLQAPSWFDCFDAGQLTQDIESGEALAFLSERNIADGVDRVVAVYGDGRAFAWHQFNEKFGE